MIRLIETRVRAVDYTSDFWIEVVIEEVRSFSIVKDLLDFINS